MAKIPPINICKSWTDLLDTIKREAVKHENFILKSCDFPQDLRLGWLMCIPGKDDEWKVKFYALPIFKIIEIPDDIKCNMKGESNASVFLTKYIEDYIFI